MAAAQPTDADRATARALAHEGYDAEKHGQYAVAADRFARADALVHAPTLLLGLARAQVGLGKLVEAQETYERILHEPLAPNAPPPFEKAVEDAKRELTDLTPRIAWVTVSVGGPSSPSVTLDDAPLPAAALGVRRACDPGEHWVKASAAGYAPTERTFIVTEGSEQTVALAMDPLPAAVLPIEHTLRTPSPEMPLETKLAVAAFGVGAAGLITGGAAGIWVLVRHASLSHDCAMSTCPVSESAALSTYRAMANLSTVALIVGGLGAATGTALLLATPKGSSVSAYAGPLSAGVAGTF